MDVVRPNLPKPKRFRLRKQPKKLGEWRGIVTKWVSYKFFLCNTWWFLVTSDLYWNQLEIQKIWWKDIAYGKLEQKSLEESLNV